MNNELITYFTLNLKDFKIVQCNNKNMIDYDFFQFYKKILKDLIIDKELLNYNYDTILNNLIKKNSITFKDNKKIISFNVDKYDDECINCTVFQSIEDISSNNFDYLTSLYNRNYVTIEIEKKLKEKLAFSYALGIIDLNNFKNINDKYGHLVGDKVLKSFSKSLSEVTKGYLVGRYGGDEFVVFIENPTRSLLEELSKKILDLEYVQSSNENDIVTACLGFTLIANPNVNFDFLFEKADVSLYKAKKNDKRSAYLDDELLYRKPTVHNKIKKKDRKSFLLEEEIRKTRFTFTSIGLSIILILSLLFVFMYFHLRNSLLKSNEIEMKNTMSMISDQIQANVDANVETCFSQLTMLGKVIENDDDSIDALKAINDTLVFDELGVLLDNGEIKFYNRSYNIVQEDITKEIIINGKPYVDNIYMQTVGERIIFAVPYKSDVNNNSTIKGIVGIMLVETFQSYLVSTSFNGMATIAITSHEGNRIISSENSTIENNNILTFLKNNFDNATYASLKQAYRNNDTKTFEINENGVSTYMFFTSFKKGLNSSNVDWHIIITVPKSEINAATTKTFSIILLIFFLVGTLLFLIISIFLYVFSFYKIKIKYSKYTDELTGGLNHRRFSIDALTLCKTRNDYAAVLVDMIRFKYINEDIGKQKGDELIKIIHDYFLQNLDRNELIGRVYADRFILLLKSKDIENRILNINQNLKMLIHEGFHLNVTLVYGIYSPNKRIDDINAASNMARVALQQARNNYAINPVGYFDDSMYVIELEKNNLERKADTALINHNFIVYYQAKRNIQEEKWASSEALVRWKDDDNSLIPPYKFIPLFEENGFITKLDLYVFEVVCKDIMDELNSGNEPIPVSFNVSRKHFVDEDFLNNYQKIIAKYNVPAKYLEFEITESAIFENETLLLKIINQIHSMGCKCAIDDFGTGYSSLSMLTNYDFDVIKFDRSFFYGKQGFNDNSREVVKSIIELGHRLNKEIVCEGIEDIEMVNYLKSVNCDVIQGYYYAKPLPLDEYLALTRKK